MITIEDNNGNKILCKGKLHKKTKLRGLTTTTSTNGIQKRAYTRKVRNYQLDITELNSNQYDILCNMLGETLYIQDNIRNIEDGNLLFNSDEINLQDVEDKYENEIYYTGSLDIVKS